VISITRGAEGLLERLRGELQKELGDDIDADGVAMSIGLRLTGIAAVACRRLMKGYSC